MALVGFQGRGGTDGVQRDFCHALFLETRDYRMVLAVGQGGRENGVLSLNKSAQQPVSGSWAYGRLNKRRNPTGGFYQKPAGGLNGCVHAGADTQIW
jgi:hypothetical protein